MVREVTKLVRELKQWSEGEPEAPTTARGPASGGVGTGVVVGTGGRYRCLDEPR
jgi:hypothetical protein